MLTLGWSDGYSFIIVDFAMMSSANKENRIQDISAEIEKRSCGFKRRTEVKEIIRCFFQCNKNALKQGVSASYVLMDTWFTHQPMIQEILCEGLDVIGMVKKLKQRYIYNGVSYTLPELRTLMPKHIRSNILGSVIAQTKNGITVKLVFVINRNNKREWLTVLSTDLMLSEEKIIRIYDNYWSIEVFFKSIKLFMKLGTEFHVAAMT